MRNQAIAVVSLAVCVLLNILFSSVAWAQETTCTVQGNIGQIFDPTASIEEGTFTSLENVRVFVVAVDGDIKNGTEEIVVPDSDVGTYQIVDGELLDSNGATISWHGTIYRTNSDYEYVFGENQTRYGIGDDGVVFDSQIARPVGSLLYGGFTAYAEAITTETGQYSVVLPEGTYALFIDRDDIPFAGTLYQDGVQFITVTAETCPQADLNFTFATPTYNSGNFVAFTTHKFTDSPENQLRLGATLKADLSPYGTFSYTERRDGIIDIPTNVFENTTIDLHVDVQGEMPTAGAMLGIWIDWDQSQTFESDEFTFYEVETGINTFTISVPSSLAVDVYGGRLRLFAGDQIAGNIIEWTDFQGDVVNGEVEDFTFPAISGPTAITLTPITATTSTHLILITLFALVILFSHRLIKQ